MTALALALALAPARNFFRYRIPSIRLLPTFIQSTTLHWPQYSSDRNNIARPDIGNYVDVVLRCQMRSECGLDDQRHLLAPAKAPLLCFLIFLQSTSIL
jgi:hypothetical protein